MAQSSTLSPGLLAEIERVGYYPALLADTLETSIAGEDVRAFVLHHEPHFDRDEIFRHVSVLALTPTRLIVSHTDENTPDDEHPLPYAVTSTEAVPISRLGSVVVSRTVTEPATYTAGQAATEVVMTVGWGAVSRLDLEPATCGDPNCEADHGYSGTATADDFSLRVSGAADGAEMVGRVLTFAKALSAASVLGAS